MHPLKIFVFALIILLISIGFRYNKSHVDLQLPPFVEFKVDSVFDMVPNQVLPLPGSDSTMSFFEGCKADSCFANFIDQLKISEDTIVRIVFLGDSQLEGDFFTMPLRMVLQQIYGGNGIGYLPAEMYFNTTEKVAIITSDFKKHVVHSGMQESDEFGLYGRFFTPNQLNAELRIKNRDGNHRYRNLKIIYSGKANLSIVDENKASTDFVLDSDKMDAKVIRFENTPTDLKLKFTDNQHLKLYGILLDPVNGVVVDHVPFRGNLNLMLNHFGEKSAREMGNLLRPALIVLQYGLNVIPDVRPDYENYRIAVQRDIQLLKKYVPQASVLVIGAPDMAHKVDGEMHSYANIGKIIAAQKEAAISEGVAFWNMRKAMGGKESVIQWVDEDLARTDYAHLNANGSEKMARIFSSDLLQFVQHQLKSE